MRSLLPCLVSSAVLSNAKLVNLISRMKNTIIVLLVSALLFFVVQALGLFEFGSIFDHEYRNWYADKRAQAVNAAPEWRLAMAYDEKELPTHEFVKGAQLAVELINRKGGVLGRPLNLQVRGDAASSPQYNAAVQSFCEDFSVAAIIGPYRSGDIPSARALTQLQAMPLVSPVTVASEKLPPLTPDNFVTFFPPLSSWVEVLLSDMEKRGFREVLLVSPESGSYGDIFCTAIERASRTRLNGCHVVRVNYQSPLRMQKIMSAMRNHTMEGGVNAVFFGGKHADYLEFGRLLDSLQISLPVYVSDDAYMPDSMAVPGVEKLMIPETLVEDLPAEYMEAWKAANDGRLPSYHACLNAVTIYAIADSIQKNGGYHPFALFDSLMKIRDARKNHIILHEKTFLEKK